MYSAVQCTALCNVQRCGVLQQGCVCKDGVNMQNAVLAMDLVLVMLQLRIMVCLTVKSGNSRWFHECYRRCGCCHHFYVQISMPKVERYVVNGGCQQFGLAEDGITQSACLTDQCSATWYNVRNLLCELANCWSAQSNPLHCLKLLFICSKKRDGCMSLLLHIKAIPREFDCGWQYRHNFA